MTDLCSI